MVLVPRLLQLEMQATYNDVKEMQLFELDRLLKKEARDAELVIGEEIENIEPQFDSDTG